jgi:hypothetical protein
LLSFFGRSLKTGPAGRIKPRQSSAVNKQSGVRKKTVSLPQSIIVPAAGKKPRQSSAVNIGPAAGKKQSGFRINKSPAAGKKPRQAFRSRK